MRTLLICIVLPIVALGQASNPATRIPNEKLAVPLQFLQRLNNTVATAVSQLRSNILNLQYAINNYEKMRSSCAEIRKYNNMVGVRTLFVGDRKIHVYCDQSTDNGGWIVIQRRHDGSVDFYRDWAQYECGFGNLLSEFWLGLDNIHYLTNTKKFTLRVDIRDFDGSSAYAVYNTFNIADAQNNYQLNIGGYRGTAGDSFDINDKEPFSTFDRDNDRTSKNCARDRQGAWWYSSCSNSNLNGRYKLNGARGKEGVEWFFWKKDIRSYKHVEMKIKELNFY